MVQNYIFHSTCYAAELLRQEEICLNDHRIDYQVKIKENSRLTDAPLSSYFEAEIQVSKQYFKGADRLIKDIIKEFS